MSKKPKCFGCKYRGNVAGSVHSSCRYPGNKFGLFDFFSNENRVNAQKLNIKADVHGIRSGWFMWPVDFDPVWLENCDGFAELEINTDDLPY